MKKKLLFLVPLFFIGCWSMATNSINSIEVKGGITNYFIYEKNHPELNFINYQNFGGTVCFDIYLSENKNLNIGINYTTKNYYINSKLPPTQANNYYNGREFYINYLNFPITIEHRLYKTKHFDLGAITGLVINHRINYRIKYNYLNDDPKIYDGDDYYRHNNFGSARLGVFALTNISSNINLKIEPFVDYKFLILSDPTRNDPRNLSDDRLSIGLNLGFVFNTKIK